MKIHAACNRAIRQQEVEKLKAIWARFFHAYHMAQLDGFDIKPSAGVLFVLIIIITSNTKTIY